MSKEAIIMKDNPIITAFRIFINYIRLILSLLY